MRTLCVFKAFCFGLFGILKRMNDSSSKKCQPTFFSSLSFCISVGRAHTYTRVCAPSPTPPHFFFPVQQRRFFVSKASPPQACPQTCSRGAMKRTRRRHQRDGTKTGKTIPEQSCANCSLVLCDLKQITTDGSIFPRQVYSSLSRSCRLTRAFTVERADSLIYKSVFTQGHSDGCCEELNPTLQVRGCL